MSPAVRRYVADPLERAGSTFVQQITVILLASGAAAGGLASTSTLTRAVDIAALAAVASLLTSVLTFPLPKLAPYPDLGVRVLKTALQSFAAVLIADQTIGVVHADWRGAVATAVATAVAAAVKGLAALSLPFTVGASLLTSPAGKRPPVLGSVKVGVQFVPEGTPGTVGTVKVAAADPAAVDANLQTIADSLPTSAPVLTGSSDTLATASDPATAKHAAPVPESDDADDDDHVLNAVRIIDPDTVPGLIDVGGDNAADLDGSDPAPSDAPATS